MIDISLEPIAGYGFYLPFVAVAAFCPIAGGIAQRKMRREVISGYTTIPFGFDYVDLRDPRSGVLLRPAGIDFPPRKMTLSFRRARELAKVSGTSGTSGSHVS